MRDLLLGRSTADVDIAVRGNGLDVAQDVARELNGKYVMLDAVNRVGRVVLSRPGGSQCLDFSSFDSDINADLKRRDFTINAMAIPFPGPEAGVQAGPLLDPTGGQADLKKRLLRAVSDGVFRSDGARLMRAVRLAGEMGLVIEPGTETLMRRDAALLDSVAGERVREELVRVLDLDRAGALLMYMEQLGLLLAVFPELKPEEGFEQPREHYWDVLTHSLQAVSASEFLLRQRTWEYGGDELLAWVPWSDRLREHFAAPVARDSNRSMMLKLSCLLHDIGKPGTKEIGPDGKWRFYGHGQLGAGIARGALERLRFSSREARLVELEVYYHLRPAQMTQDALPTRRAIFRYYRDCAGAGYDVFFLAMSDYLATHGPRLDIEDWKEHGRLMAYVFAEHESQEIATGNTQIIDGHDIMNVFGLQPGPKVGQLLLEVKEARAAGRIATRDEALELVGERLSGAKDKERQEE